VLAATALAAGVVAEGVTPFALSALKYGLLALLFLFVWRSMRWVLRGLGSEQPAAAMTPTRGAGKGAPPGVPMPSTLLVHGADGGKPHAVRLDASATVGRAPECELRIDDTYVSQQHARIFGKNGSWYVEDLGSTNGTFVNEQRLAAPAMLQPGDKIRVGTTVMELRR
jgi:pSer/pThr/pTyr-binding forkhead associated (FHA) protein